MERVRVIVFGLMPPAFGVGFIAPLIAQIIEHAGWRLPLGIPPVGLGLAIGLTWGVCASWKGRWL